MYRELKVLHQYMPPCKPASCWGDLTETVSLSLIFQDINDKSRCRHLTSFAPYFCIIFVYPKEFNSVQLYTNNKILITDLNTYLSIIDKILQDDALVRISTSYLIRKYNFYAPSHKLRFEKAKEVKKCETCLIFFQCR